MNEYENIATNVVVHGVSRLSTITPTSGRNAGKLTDVLSVRAFHPNFKFNKESGTFDRTESDWYNVKYYGAAAKKISEFLKDGLVLEVRGSVTESTFTGKDGKVRTGKEINAKCIAVALNQPGLRAIDFEKPEKKQETAKEETGHER